VFIPGISGDLRVMEEAYEQMRRQVQHDGRPPPSRRIPLHDGIALAIFDMGRQQPFVVAWEHDCGNREQERETLGCNAYSVLGFDA
jgi:hypothetical protein